MIPRSAPGLLLSLGLIAMTVLDAPAQAAASFLGTLSPGETVHGFRADAVYLDAMERPIGGRFVHRKTGFTLDALQIQSVPQGFIWVASYPTSDMGEPHTQEHLLLGKGNQGRFVADLENMSLGQSSAFVQGWRTAYHFNVAAGPEVYYNLFERQMDALLHPDYTDEEIRREVRNFGVTVNPDGSLRLEEKGTVYNEMVSSFDRPSSLPYRALQQMIYGERHPLSYSAGGFPAAIRDMRPEHIRKFHADNYQLANMGMVGSFPKEMPLRGVLERTDRILTGLQGEQPVQRDFVTEETLPRPEAAPEGTIRTVEYPHQNPQQPSPLYFAWPAQLDLEPRDRGLLELFLGNLAGDPTTNLYRIFIDTKTREIDLGARGVGAWVSDDLGHPVAISFSDVPAAQMTPERIGEVRARILEEIRRIAALEPGSPELAEFNRRLASRVTEARRELSNFVNSPPGFGQRSMGSAWISHLHDLSRTEGFRKSLTREEDLAWVERTLASGGNPWREAVRRWKLDTTTPYAVAARPSGELIRQANAERAARAEAELKRLATEYGTADEQETIRRYQAEYDAETARLEEIASRAEKPRFIDAPPMTLDESLDYRVEEVAPGVPVVVSTFDNMTSATAGVALRLDAVRQEDLVYLALLPSLLTQVGVVRDGVPVPYTQMREALRNEVLGLNAYTAANPRTGRVELVVRGAGNSMEESRRAARWMQDVLFHADWRPENLSRIRDVVDQSLAGLRNTTQRSEESWVDDPATAYRRQADPLWMASQSFQTRAHNAHRLRWMLKEAPAGADGAATLAFLERLATVEGSRDERRALLAALQETDSAVALPPALAAVRAEHERLPAAARPVVAEAARDLALLVPEVPDASLAADWSYLVRQIRADLAVPPARALSELDAVRARLLHTANARAFVIGSREGQQVMGEGLRSLVGRLSAAPVERLARDGRPLVTERLRGRSPGPVQPVFVGLVNPNTQGGVFLNSAPLAGYGRTDREGLLEFLAAKLYAGGGAHSMFMKTWGAGLAYSNGLRSSPAAGRLMYYAERVPELPQTLRFVIDELEDAPRDPALVEYAIAQAFSELRSGRAYEARGEAMAADLADDLTPDKVRAFRQAILELRKDPQLAAQVHDRMEEVYGRVLPGYGAPTATVEGGSFFVIGPESQLRLYEEYLRGAEGAQAELHRLYPRDFWMTAAVEGGS